MSDDIANSFIGKRCPHCGKGILYYTELRTLACSECEKAITVDNLMMSEKMPDIVVRTIDDSGTREFIGNFDIGTEDLIRELVQSHVLLERCARAEPKNDHIQTLMHISKHTLENLGIHEVEIGEFTNERDIVLVNGKHVWIDPSIFEEGAPW